MNLETRPTMEAMIDRYRTFERDLVSQLDSSFGKRSWRLPGGDDVLRSGCGEDVDPSGRGESVVLPAQEFQGSYPADLRDRVRDLVVAVGKEHGFTDVVVHMDNAIALDLVGRDRYGAVYHFGDGDSTGFYISSGCHRWQHPPAPDELP